MSEKVTISHEVESPPTSLARMLKSQYTSKEFNDVFAATELREREIIILSTLFMTRFVNMILSTSKEDLKDIEGQQLQDIKERLAIKRRIETSLNAMEFLKQDSFMYAFGLLRQSLKRKSRAEARDIAMSPRPVASASEIGRKDKLFARLGISGKYKRDYMEK